MSRVSSWHDGSATNPKACGDRLPPTGRRGRGLPWTRPGLVQAATVWLLQLAAPLADDTSQLSEPTPGHNNAAASLSGQILYPDRLGVPDPRKLAGLSGGLLQR